MRTISIEERIAAAGTCEHCKRQMRPNKMTALEAPNTMQRRGEGICTVCAALLRRAAQNASAEVSAKVAADRAGLEAYFRARRARGVSPYGIQFEGEAA